MPKILVIEDETVVRESLLDLLQVENFEVRGAENGLVGLNLARQERPDLIICDVMMPELDGYQLLSILQKEQATASIPFIFLTARSDKDDLRQAMTLGADDYLTKPFTCHEILQSVETRLLKRAVISKQSELRLEELRKNLARSLPHELITPLSIILMSTERLLDQNGVFDQEFTVQALVSIHNAGERLNLLIQKFLKYAELELIATDTAKIEKLRNTHTSAVKLILSSLANEKAKKMGREHDLQLQLEDSSARISIENLEDLIEELLDNAFRYSTTGTTVLLQSVSNPDLFVLNIIDNGRGLTPEEIATSGAYVQHDRAKHEQQGIGLGLTLAKRLTQLHGGELTITRIAGQQTSVQLSLPH